MKSHDYHVSMQDILLLCMWHLMAKGCRVAIIWLSHVLKKVCVKVMDPRAMVDLKKDVVVILVLLKKKSLLFYIYNDTSPSAFSWGTKDVWSNTYLLDLPHWTWHEDIKGICEKQRKTRRKYGRRVCTRGSFRVLHKIFVGLYRNKTKGVGW